LVAVIHLYKIGISFIFDPKRRNIIISKGKKKILELEQRLKNVVLLLDPFLYHID